MPNHHLAGLAGDQKTGSVPDISALGPGAYGIGNEPNMISGIPAYMERMTTDISALKKQYQKLRQRQTQAHIILTAASAKVKAVGPNIETPTAMNHLFIGKHDSKGRNRLVAVGPRIAPVFPTPTFVNANPQNASATTQGVTVVETKKKWMLKLKGKTEVKGSPRNSPVHSPTIECAQQSGSSPNLDQVQKCTDSKENVSQTLKSIGIEPNSELCNNSNPLSDSASERNSKTENEQRIVPDPQQSSVKEQEFISDPSSACSQPCQEKSNHYSAKTSTIPCNPIMKGNSDVPENPSSTSQKYQVIFCSVENIPTKKVKLKDLAKLYSESQKLADVKKNGIAGNDEEESTIMSNTGMENSNGRISLRISGTPKIDDSSDQTSGTAENDFSSYKILAGNKSDDSTYQTLESAKYDELSYQSPGSAKYDSSYLTPGSAKYYSSYQTPGFAKYDSSYQTSGSAKYDSSYQTSGSAKYDSSYRTSGSAKYDSSYQTPGSAKNYSSYQISGSAEYDDSVYQNIVVVPRASDYVDSQVIEGDPNDVNFGNIDCNSCTADSSENAQNEISFTPLQEKDVHTAHTHNFKKQADNKDIIIQRHPINSLSKKYPDIFSDENIVKQVYPETKYVSWGIDESSSDKKSCNNCPSTLRNKLFSATTADDSLQPASMEPLTLIENEMSVCESHVMQETESHEQISGNGDMRGEEQESSVVFSSISCVKARTLLWAADSLCQDSISTRFKSGSFSGKESEKEMEKILLTKTMSDSCKPEELQPVTKSLSGSSDMTKSAVMLNSIDSDSGSEVSVSSDDIRQSKSFQQYYSNKRSMSATSNQVLDNHQPKNRSASRPFNPFPIKHVNQNRARTGVKLGLYKMSTLEKFEKNIKQPVWGK